MSKKVVIVGGVAGGASCAARFRRLDQEAEIVLLERGGYISYANCGLPYHVGDVIPERESLLLLDPAVMRSRYNIDVRVRNEVKDIHRKAKMIDIMNLETGEVYSESYDILVLATGSSPMRPPLPGMESPRVRTLWSVPDMDEIKEFTKVNKVKKAVVVGGGFIGLEMVENLCNLGIKVTLVEMLDQVMAPLDYEMAVLLNSELLANGVDLRLSMGVKSFKDNGKTVDVALADNSTIAADIVLLSIGVKPNGELAKACGLKCNERGGIVVDTHLRTEDESIYAVGDVIEVRDFIDDSKTMIPLAGPANKQGRIAANNIAGGDQTYKGSMGTSVAKVFSMTAASTGLNEKVLQKRGLKKDEDYKSVLIQQASHAGYYPGAEPTMLKLIFSPDGKKIFGAQVVSKAGADKRIDVLATAIRLGASVYDLQELELAYAPPYSSAKDPVNMLGFVAENLLTGNVSFAPWDYTIGKKDIFLDIRKPDEHVAFSVPGTTDIPFEQLRERFSELDKEKHIVILCAAGVRAYNAYLFLRSRGFKNLSVYPGGVKYYKPSHYKDFPLDVVVPSCIVDEKKQGKAKK